MTINTDASFDPNTKRAAWAYWIKSHDQLFKASGVIPTASNSSTAELIGISQAIAKVKSFVESEWGEDFPKERITLYINTDSTWAISALERKYKNSKHQKFVNKILRRIPNFDIQPRHVKAHNGTADARSWVNDWCDKEAKARLRKSLKKGNRK